MEPVSITIGAIIAIGLANLGVKAANDAYNALKLALQRKFGIDSEVAKALENLEKKPDSAGRKETLDEEIEAVGANQDEEIVALAKELERQLVAQPGYEQYNQTVSGRNNQAIQAKGDRDVNIHNYGSNSASRKGGKKGSTLPENIDEATAALLSEIYSYFLNTTVYPVELQRKFDAWELLVRPKFDDDGDLQRLERLCTTIEAMIEGGDLSGFSRSEIRREVQELATEAKRPPKAVWGLI